MALSPGKGKILLAQPFLQDPNFKRTVVLLCEHNEQGSLGFVLNQPTDYEIHEVLTTFPELPTRVCIGGPVQQDSLHFVHCVPELAEEGDEIGNGIYWGGNFETLVDYVRRGLVTASQVRFFLGYSGWSAGQLESELLQGSWIVARSTVAFAFSGEYDELWKNILQSMGKMYRRMANYPEDPSLN